MNTTRYWCDDNGAITCETHAGNYLSSGIKARPNAKTHRTPLGTFEMLHDDEVAELLTMMQGMKREHICEMCDHLAVAQ